MKLQNNTCDRDVIVLEVVRWCRCKRACSIQQYHHVLLAINGSHGEVSLVREPGPSYTAIWHRVGRVAPERYAQTHTIPIWR